MPCLEGEDHMTIKKDNRYSIHKHLLNTNGLLKEHKVETNQRPCVAVKVC